MYRIVVTLILSIMLLSCAISPTGRKQVLLYSDGEMSKMGIAAYDSMKKEQPLLKDAKTTAYVQCITNRLIPHLPKSLQGNNWEVNVFKDDTPNAFALPGAKIGVNSGMLTLADNQAMLAAVIGHEIGHVWAQHGNERMSQNTLAQAGMTVASVVAGESTTESQLALGALGLATKGVVLSYSRKHESEADGIGLEMMAKAGFDPQQAVELWRKMAEKSGGSQVPEFFSTHPSEEHRIKDLQKKMKSVMPLYEQAKKNGGLASCTK